MTETQEKSSSKTSRPWYLCSCCCVIEITESGGLSLHKPPNWDINHSQENSTPPQLRITIDDGDEEAKYPAFARESTKSIDLNDPITLEDLQKIIPTIDQDLEGSIKTWEDSFRKYQELENRSLEVIGPELVQVLGKLREDPDAFLNSSNPAIRSLARTRNSLYASTSRGDSKESRESLEITTEGKNGDLRRKSLNLGNNSRHHISDPIRAPRRGSLPDFRPMSMNSIVSYSQTERISEFSNGHHLPDVVTNSREGTSLVFGNRRIQSLAMSRSTSGPLPQSNPLHPTMGTKELSLIWAGRLAELSPAHGQLSKQVGLNGQVISLKLTPKWPNWLSDCLYDVIKTNKYGKRQRRTLKLTEFHLLNIKDGKSVTKVVPYGGIIRINLTSPRSFTVDYEIRINSNEMECGTLYYESLLSAHIVQQVTTRAQIRRDLDKIGRTTSNEAVDRLGYSVGVTESMIQTITELVTKNNSDITQFALLLGRRTFEQLQSINPNLVDAETPSPLSSPSPAARKSSFSRQNTPDISSSMRRLLSIQQGSGEYRLKNLIQKIILDVQSPEGNTLRHFLQNFPNIPKEKNINELRQFIDGLYEYLIENHVSLFASSLQSSDEGESSTSDFITRSTSNSSQLSGKSNTSSSPHPLNTASPIPSLRLTEQILVSVSYIAYTVVEETLFLALQPKIISYCLSFEVRENAEELLLRKMKVLSSRSQQEFDIPGDHRSPTDWSNAVFELAGVERNPTPSMRIHALVRAARAIYTEYKTQIAPRKQLEKRLSSALNSADSATLSPSSLTSSIHSSSPPLSIDDSTESILGADDFLPIFIYVFCRSDLEHPIQNKDLLWKLCHPGQLQGESGYYLTIYESAVEYVLAYDIPEELLQKVQIPTPQSIRNIQQEENHSSISSISKFFSFKQQK